ncbi:hypothetical protein ACFL5W_00610 [Thermodesulfobacteriota bacterium]
MTCFAPAFLRVGFGPRAYHGSPRPLGQLLYLVHILAIISFMINDNYLCLVISFIFGGLIVISSKFTVQVCILNGLILLAFGFFQPLVCFIIGLLLFGLITKGKAFRIFTTQVKFSAYYCKHLQKRYLYPFSRNYHKYKDGLIKLFKCYRLIPEFLKGNIEAKKALQSSLSWILKENYWPHLLLTTFPQIVILTVCVFFVMGKTQTSVITDSNVLTFIKIWIFGGIGLMVATSIKPLLFLGEASRYLENSIMPQMFLSTLLIVITDCSFFLPLLFIYFIILYIAYVILYFVTFEVDQYIFKKVLPALQSIDEKDTRVASIGTYFFALLYGMQNSKVLCPMSDLSFDDWERCFGNYPYPQATIEKIVKKYRITHLIGSDSTIADYEEKSQDDSFSRHTYKEKERIGNFIIYETGESVGNEAK